MKKEIEIKKDEKNPYDLNVQIDIEDNNVQVELVDPNTLIVVREKNIHITPEQKENCFMNMYFFLNRYMNIDNVDNIMGCITSKFESDGKV